MAIAAAAVAAGIGAYKLIKGANDSAAAKKRALYNIRPNYDIAPEYFRNQSIAGNLAGEGLTEDSKAYYTDQADRGLGSSIGTLLQTGGGINNIQDLYDKYDNNNRAIATAGSQQEIQNIQNLMKANNDVADQRTQQWVLNRLQPFQDEAKSISAQKVQGAGETNSGLNTISGAVSSYAGAITPQEDSIAKQGRGDYISTTGVAGTGVPDASTATNQGIISNYKVPSYTLPSSAMNVNLPDSYDDLPNFDNSSRNVAMTHIMNKYKNSPYITNLPYYLQSA